MDKIRFALYLILFFLSLDGFILHYRVHPFLVPDEFNPEIVYFKFPFFMANLFSVIDLVVVNLLFISRRTFIYGYLLNGLIAFYGIILMGHYAISKLISGGYPFSFENLFLQSVFPHQIVGLSDFLVGYLLFEHIKNSKKEVEYEKGD
ncbi:MAG: hypothetical protein ABWJ99_08910 [Caldimicrobium sp.]